MEDLKVPLIYAPVVALHSGAVMPKDGENALKDAMDRKYEAALKKAHKAMSLAIHSAAALSNFARAQVANIIVRRNIWLKHWKVDTLSKSNLATEKFSGRLLFGESNLDKALIVRETPNPELRIPFVATTMLGEDKIPEITDHSNTLSMACETPPSTQQPTDPEKVLYQRSRQYDSQIGGWFQAFTHVWGQTTTDQWVQVIISHGYTDQHHSSHDFSPGGEADQDIGFSDRHQSQGSSGPHAASSTAGLDDLDDQLGRSIPFPFQRDVAKKWHIQIPDP
ncbi:UNVERIFIED_CONTAM: hypothetical protein K2H54_055058 [Gekko kuhli]